MKKKRKMHSAETCHACGAKRRETRAPHEMSLVGPWSVRVEDAVAVRCTPGCEYDGMIGYDRMEGILSAVAAAVISKPSRLAPEEIRFLRRRLELDGKELAARLGVTNSTVSRWENGREAIGATPDHLLRALVALAEREQAGFHPSILSEIDHKEGRPLRIAVRRDASGEWHRVAA